MPLANRHVTTDKTGENRAVGANGAGFIPAIDTLYRLCHDTHRYTQIRSDRPIVLFRAADGRARRKTDIIERAAAVGQAPGREAQAFDMTRRPDMTAKIECRAGGGDVLARAS